MSNQGKKAKWKATLLSVIGLLLFWQFMSWLLDIGALPGPVPSFKAFFYEMLGPLKYHFYISTYRVLVSLAVSLLLAVPLGLFLGREEKSDRYFAPLIYIVYPIPKIVFLPVLMVLAGLQDLSKITLIILVVFFQILVTTRDAARGINRELINSVLSLGATRLDIYKHVIGPAVIPEVLTSLRIASGTAIAVLFTSETVASQEGLGYYLLDAWSGMSYDHMFAGIIAMSLMGFVIYVGLDYLEKRVCPWKSL
ncbi:ABC transporter permease [Desulforamulus ruminis]|uniref:Binding-protein-dependent transport systems inner membrane component n=1 Tax=Desulforamulus ruminis (strain ATCC 23193 / DSM 2154 / NCIMB 8452 / DL) TaxID=696281 RepID=F6DVH8_DESRL|nr:ABC transporter permease [Desulforamulus ruminis]AEG61438.1 binding-protein-dependent transport systems inner membrane component [Desulforamulus ruminis DSM 2154]